MFGIVSPGVMGDPAGRGIVKREQGFDEFYDEDEEQPEYSQGHGGEELTDEEPGMSPHGPSDYVEIFDEQQDFDDGVGPTSGRELPDDVLTVGKLKAMLAKYPDDMPVGTMHEFGIMSKSEVELSKDRYYKASTYGGDWHWETTVDHESDGEAIGPMDIVTIDAI